MSSRRCLKNTCGAGRGRKIMSFPIAIGCGGWAFVQAAAHRPSSYFRLTLWDEISVAISEEMSGTVTRNLDHSQSLGSRGIAILLGSWAAKCSRRVRGVRRTGNSAAPDRKDFLRWGLNRDGDGFLMRYEGLADDYAAFVRSLGVAEVPELPHAKGETRPGSARRYREVYTDKSREAVRSIYRREIKVFGYEF